MKMFTAILAAVSLYAVLAAAQEAPPGTTLLGPPGIDFGQHIQTPDGKDIPYCPSDPPAIAKPSCSNVLTLGVITENALLATYNDETPSQQCPTCKLDGDVKAKRGALAIAIAGATHPLVLDPDSLKIIKDIVGKAYGPLEVARAWTMLGVKLPNP